MKQRVLNEQLRDLTNGGTESSHKLNGRGVKAIACAEPPLGDPVSRRKGRVFMALLAVQYGLQPLLQKACVDKDTVNKTSFVMVTEFVKVVLCLVTIISSGRRTYKSMFQNWSLRESLMAAATPAALYALQNWLAQVAYMNLDSLTFNLLNQTKTLFAALCLYLVMGRRQSVVQLLALAMLLFAAVLLNAHSSSSRRDEKGALGLGGDGRVPWWSSESQLWLGVFPVIGASFLSGLSASVTQRTLQCERRNSYLLSMELAVYGVMVLLISTIQSEDGERIRQDGFLYGWTPYTLVPLFSQALGGMVVGQVTKHAGSVQKGFALIAGILVTAAVQTVLENSSLSATHWIAAVLVAAGTYLHASFPHQQRSKAE
ncbi:unnamed protein product [Discosporangium mesarthrocarpum]